VVAHVRQGAADCGQYRQVAGAGAQGVMQKRPVCQECRRGDRFLRVLCLRIAALRQTNSAATTKFRGAGSSVAVRLINGDQIAICQPPSRPAQVSMEASGLCLRVQSADVTRQPTTSHPAGQAPLAAAAKKIKNLVWMPEGFCLQIHFQIWGCTRSAMPVSERGPQAEISFYFF
jgi:hypothetical protein